MKIRNSLFLTLFLLVIVIQGCLDDKDKEPCGETLGDITFNTLPEANKFVVVQVDTLANEATLRYTGADWENICTRDSVGLSVNVQGGFTEIKACLHWSPADSIVFEVTNAGPLWSGRSANKDISGVHGNGPGVIYTSVDFTFGYSDSITTLAALHNHLSGIFTGLYIDPVGYRFKP